MQAGDLSNWFGWGAGVIFALIGIALLIFSVFGEQMRGRPRSPRCPKCWYDMTGTPSLTCPECGKTARNEKHLHRPRRRWKLAILACLFFLPQINNIIVDRYGKRWWMSAMPTAALIHAIPIMEGLPDVFRGELTSRLGRADLSAADWDALFARCLRGDRGARPVSDPWQRKYGRIIATYSEQFTEYCIRTGEPAALPPLVTLTGFRNCVPDLPVPLLLDVTTWWPPGTDARIRATPIVDRDAREDQSIILFRRNDAYGSRSFPLFIRDVKPGASSVAVRFEMECRHREFAPEWRPVETVTVAAPLEWVETLDDVMQPLTDPALTEYLMRIFNGEVACHPRDPDALAEFIEDPRRRLGTYLSRRGVGISPVTDVAIGVHVDTLRNGEVRHTLSIWWNSGATGRTSGYRWYHQQNGYDFVDQINNDGATWTMRVRSDPALALRVPGTNSYWMGEFEQPITIRDRERPQFKEEWVLFSPEQAALVLTEQDDPRNPD